MNRQQTLILCVSTLPNCTGGWDTNDNSRAVYKFEPKDKAWVRVGKMKHGRRFHGASVIQAAEVEQYCQNVSFTCPAGTDKAKETFPVKAGDIHTFKTNEAPKYGKDMKCKVNYIMDASCNMMELSCIKMKLGDGDFFFVDRDGLTEKYEIINTCIE